MAYPGQGCFYSSAEENFVNFMSGPPSLLSIAMTSVAVQLWLESDVNSFTLDSYKACEHSVLQKLEHIPLPNFLKIEVTNFIRHIGSQRLKFIRTSVATKYRHKIGNPCYWNMDGTIDIVRLLKEDIHATLNESNEITEIIILFKKACEYCIDKETILKLWLKVKNGDKPLNFFHGNNSRHLLIYWTYYFENKFHSLLKTLKSNYYALVDGNLSISVNMVSISICFGHDFSFRYFWGKLEPEEINYNIERWLNISLGRCKNKNSSLWFDEKIHPCEILNLAYEFNFHTNILCFLLSKVAYLKQKEVFDNYSKIILNSLLCCWPLQKFITPTVAAMTDHLLEKEHYLILSNITILIKKKMASSFLLRDIWQLYTLKLRKRLLNLLAKDSTPITRLMDVGDVITVGLIFKDGTETEIKRIIFNMIEKNDFQVPNYLQN